MIVVKAFAALFALNKRVVVAFGVAPFATKICKAVLVAVPKRKLAFTSVDVADGAANEHTVEVPSWIWLE